MWNTVFFLRNIEKKSENEQRSQFCKNAPFSRSTHVRKICKKIRNAHCVISDAKTVALEVMVNWAIVPKRLLYFFRKGIYWKSIMILANSISVINETNSKKYYFSRNIIFEIAAWAQTPTGRGRRATASARSHDDPQSALFLFSFPCCCCCSSSKQPLCSPPCSTSDCDGNSSCSSCSCNSNPVEICGLFEESSGYSRQCPHFFLIFDHSHPLAVFAPLDSE